MYNFTSQGGCNVTTPGLSLRSLCSAAEHIYFITALDAAIQNHPIISGNCERIKPIDEPAEEYDFIVAGGGAGGATVAGRLAEVGDWKILVLEAGGDETAAGMIPGFTQQLVGAEIDWNYYTTNESYACLSNNGSCYVTSARVLGGNTAHNDMVYLRGNPTDYNNWAALGNDGWTWDEVLEFYKKQENNTNIDKVGRKFHGTGGPLTVGFFPYDSEFEETFMKAAEQSGFGVTNDLNGETLTGLTVLQATQKHGVRVSSAKAYLWPHRNNRNLGISLESNVTRIIMENKKAVGVEYIKNGKLRRVRAKREVIISTGSIRSPQLLLLSGIGPKEHLESKGIKTVQDLPGVGGNYHDHVLFSYTMTMNQPDTYVNNVLIANEYLQNQTGPMSTLSDVWFTGAGCTNKTTMDFPDFQVLIVASAASCAPGKVGALNSNGNRNIYISVTNLHPKSKGRISLASKNPLDYPVLCGNFLSDPSDLEVIIDGLESSLKLTEAEALTPYNLTLAIRPSKRCSNYTVPSREYWACAIRHDASLGSHPVGTCKMGPASDSMAVVDPELRVHGIKNLRVVDASIMPQVTSSNTGVPTMMIGERAADWIKKTWLPSYNKFDIQQEECVDN